MCEQKVRRLDVCMDSSSSVPQAPPADGRSLVLCDGRKDRP